MPRITIRVTPHTLDAFELALDDYDDEDPEARSDAILLLSEILHHAYEHKHIDIRNDPEGEIPLDYFANAPTIRRRIQALKRTGTPG